MRRGYPDVIHCHFSNPNINSSIYFLFLRTSQGHGYMITDYETLSSLCLN